MTAETLSPWADVQLERLGPSYRVSVDPFGASLVFRDVRLDRDLSADVTVSVKGRHLFRSTSTLSLAGRDRLAKTAQQLDGIGDDGTWRRVIFSAVEAVMEAEETLGGGVDLRDAATVTDDPLFVAEPVWPSGASLLVAPGESGKSTIARALAVSVASGQEVIPGILPRVAGPVLYVAGEDPVAFWHARSVEAICRGLGIERRAIMREIVLLEAKGRPLHRLARSLAERSADAAGVILDAQQALLPSLDQSGGVRDRDSLFWNGIDAIGRPTFILAHPNRAESRGWDDADGRAAGSEVNRDRARMSWRGAFRDEPAAVGTSFRRYTLSCTKWNHGPRPAPVSFAAAWEYGYGGDPGVLRFTEAEPVDREPKGTALSASERRTLEAYQAGATSYAALMAAVPEITSTAAAKQRLHRLREKGLIGPGTEP